jgi:hypothetical protein
MRIDVDQIDVEQDDVELFAKEWEGRHVSHICRDMTDRLGTLIRRARRLEFSLLIVAVAVVLLLAL